MSTLTQRHTGIVQRKKTKEGAEGGEYDPDVLNNLDEDEEDRDSKETRLTLMEEILLLGLKDREVNISCSFAMYLIFNRRCNTMQCCLVGVCWRLTFCVPVNNIFQSSTGTANSLVSILAW